MTLLQQHSQKWKVCQSCGLSKVRRSVVICRGTVPCEVLMVGEAPGISEDALGIPFIGPAGKLLDRQIKEACEDTGRTPKIAWTNLVGCIPISEPTNRKNAEPTAEEIEACRPRLEEFFQLSKPKLIVCVGALSAKHSEQDAWVKLASVISIKHPAAILREPITSQGLSYQRVVVQLVEAFGRL
jgi:uracil-DNA glycosylase family 4